jgi:hypothetical protein
MYQYGQLRHYSSQTDLYMIQHIQVESYNTHVRPNFLVACEPMNGDFKKKKGKLLIRYCTF